MLKNILNNYRHGDLALIEITELPKGLTETKSKVIHQGKSNTHSFDNGRLFLKNVNTFVFGYFESTNKTNLLHSEHGISNEKKEKLAKIKKGIYELRRQVEDTNEGMKQVVD
jgi:hypothetical protein